MNKLAITFLTITFLNTLLFVPARAQDKNTPVGGPARLNMNLSSNLNANSKILLGILRRVNKLGIESYFSEMQKDGIQSRSFAVNLEGALIYNYELGISSGRGFYDGTRSKVISGIADMDEIGRESGGRVLPYKMDFSFGPGGEKRISFSAFSFRNMNDYQRVYGGISSAENSSSAPGSLGFWSFVDNLELVTFTWDQNYSFNNLRTFDFQAFRIEPTVGLAGNDRYSLAFRGSTDMGGGNGDFVNNNGSRMFMSSKVEDEYYQDSDGYSTGVRKNYVYRDPNTGGIAFRWNYSAGLQYKQKFNNGDILNLQSNWRGGVHQNWLNNSDIVTSNLKLKTQYDSDHAQYKTDQAQYNISRGKFDYDKATFATNHGLPLETVTDEYYQSQNPNVVIPTAPTEPIEVAYPNNIVKAPRKYGYVTTSLSYSKLLNSKKMDSSYQLEPGMQRSRPLRLGFEVEWNLYLNDGFSSAPREVTYDFNKNNRRMMTGKIYLKF